MTTETWELILESFTKILVPGLLMTIPLTVLSFAIAMVIAVAVALIQYANIPVLKQICRFYIWIIRGTPLLVQLYIGFFGLNNIGFSIQPFAAAVLVFSINEGAYCAETIRGSLEAVSKGQLEAGYCCGMNFLQIMMHIVLPQAFRSAFPALFNSLIGMVKDTSLASNITVTEMFQKTMQIAGRTYKFMPLYLELAFIYLMFCTILTWVQRWSEKKLSHYDAQGGK